jgi:hypothetical protein
MDANTPIAPQIINPQELRIPFERGQTLSIFTGTASFTLQGPPQDYMRTTVEFDIDAASADAPAGPLCATANIASVLDSVPVGTPYVSGWAVDEVSATYAGGRLKLTARVAIAGANALLYRFNYTVFALTTRQN